MEILTLGEDRYLILFVYPLPPDAHIENKEVLSAHKHAVLNCDSVIKNKRSGQLLVGRKIIEVNYEDCIRTTPEGRGENSPAISERGEDASIAGDDGQRGSS